MQPWAEELRDKMEAYDSLAANARWNADILRRRWWRALGDPDDAAHWRQRIQEWERKATLYDIEADALRAELHRRLIV